MELGRRGRHRSIDYIRNDETHSLLPHSLLPLALLLFSLSLPSGIRDTEFGGRAAFSLPARPTCPCYHANRIIFDADRYSARPRSDQAHSRRKARAKVSLARSWEMSVRGPGVSACGDTGAISWITAWLMPCSLWPNFMVLRVSWAFSWRGEAQSMKRACPLPLRKG